MEEVERGVVTSETILKAYTIGDGATSNAVAEQSAATLFQNHGSIVPPYDPNTLTTVFEHSNSLRSNVDAMVTNIDGFGHHFLPIIDPENDDKVKDKVRRALFVERLIKSNGSFESVEQPTDVEVDKKLEELDALMAVELFKLKRFFDFVCVDQSFVALRKKTRQDLEITGNAYWEVVRGRDGKLWASTFNWLASRTMRLLPQDTRYVEVDAPTRIGPLTVSTDKVKRRFRRFIQVVDTKNVFFKEYGDPRTYSAATGREYASLNDLEKAEKGVAAATEVIHFAIHSSRGPYGVPRWIGNLLSVLGSRQAEEVNFLYFENKSVPPMALIVSGGKVSADTVSRVSDYIKNEIRGKSNFHKILVIEAVGSSDNGADPSRMRVELKPLTSAQHSDGLFQKYDERNIDKVGMSFRLSRMLRGDVRDFNRATANAALEFAESQVFNPEREAFDFTIDRLILAELGVRFHSFKSNGVQVRDPREISSIMKDLASVGALVPADMRSLASELVFNRELPAIKGDWIYQPIMLTQTGVPLDGTVDGKIPLAPKPDSPDPAAPSPSAPAKTTKTVTEKVQELVALRDGLLDAERVRAAAEFSAGRTIADAPDEPEVIKMERDALKALFAIEEL
jgi:PBSX family phage portal protein